MHPLDEAKFFTNNRHRKTHKLFISTECCIELPGCVIQFSQIYDFDNSKWLCNRHTKIKRKNQNLSIDCAFGTNTFANNKATAENANTIKIDIKILLCYCKTKNASFKESQEPIAK